MYYSLMNGAPRAVGHKKELKVLRSDERWMIHMEAQVAWVPHTAPNKMAIKDLGTLLQAIPGTPVASQKVDPLNGDEFVTLDAVEYFPPTKPVALVLLLSCTNKAGADPGFRNVVNGANRTEAKKLDEGISSSAHLVIKLKEVTNADGNYWPAALEDVPNIGKTKIQAALTTMIGIRGKFTYNKGGTEEPASARFVLHSQEAEDLVADIGNAGQISYFVATREKKPSKKFDSIEGLEPVAQTQKFRIQKNFKPEGGLKKYLSSFFGASKSAGYKKVKVTYRRNIGGTRSVTLGTHREDAEDFLIKRTDHLDMSSNPLPQMHTTISPALVQEMLKKLK
ncbi:hypothetical protein VDG05_22010 [Xanthomonas campestris pv. raphani]|nr:hypothetical protein [Xanthomonas campestris]MEA9886946.1 hypothetical protein [Xanthomonas campestris pv. raphani]MEB2183877.1 hypothetical protein [Xanthomonas campestris pv. campestris]